MVGEGKDRSQALDVVKGAMILLVVYGHLIEGSIRSDDAACTAYVFIYLFHMPAFVMVSGYLARAHLRPAHLFRRIVVPFLVAEVIYEAFAVLVLDQPVDVLRPNWILWYLVSLFCWHLMLPVFARLPLALALAVLLSLLSGFADFIGYDLSLSRTIYFFPFFLIGHRLAGRALPEAGWTTKIGAVAILAATLALIGVAAGSFPVRLLYGSLPYSSFDQASSQLMLVRAALYLVSLVLVFCVVSLLPRRSAYLAWLGRNTLAIYLAHGIVVLAARHLDLDDVPHPVLAMVPVALLLCALIATLAQGGVRRPFVRVP